jgi:hypothetical protein
MASILDLYPTFTRAWLQTKRARSSALVLSGNSVLSPKFVHAGCTATTNRVQVCAMQRLVAKQKARSKTHDLGG